MPQPKDDGVNREGLDYRAGWVEGLTALLRSLQVDSVRMIKKSHAPGLERAFEITKTVREEMIQKMSQKPQ